MKWKSFKEEKPLLNQRVLMYDKNKDYDHFCILIYKPPTIARFIEKFEKQMDMMFWCPIPNLPDENMK